MRYLSVCSGIEAASQAWRPLGWDPVAFSEIEPFPCAYLKHHYPDVPNWGDMTKFQEWTDANVDVLAGGTPCQSYSVAGLRAGLADPRGDLMLTYLAIAARYRPKWIVWENVPGVLSSNGGRDFGTFLGGLGELGYGFAYRVLDAQHVRTRRFPHAVPQRRRRVFVVGHLGDWRRAAAVLFDRESMSGHPAPRRQAGESVAGTFKACASSGGWSNSADHAAAGYMIPVGIEIGPSGGRYTDPGFTLQAAHHHAVATPYAVRRLTPAECERLMGFPDGATMIPYRNKPAAKCADGPRYKALGNSWAVNCAEWVGERIDQVENYSNSRSAVLPRWNIEPGGATVDPGNQKDE